MVRMPIEDQLSHCVIGAAIEVHRHLGPGLLESVYEECLCWELSQKRVKYERQKTLPVSYKGLKLECGYRLDIVVEDLIIVELKSVQKLEPIHDAQLLTYLKMSNLKLGLLLNFNVDLMKSGIRRIVNGL